MTYTIIVELNVSRHDDRHLSGEIHFENRYRMKKKNKPNNYFCRKIVTQYNLHDCLVSIKNKIH